MVVLNYNLSFSLACSSFSYTSTYGRLILAFWCIVHIEYSTVHIAYDAIHISFISAVVVTLTAL